MAFIVFPSHFVLSGYLDLFDIQDHCKLLENQGYRRDIIERKLVLFEFCVLRCIYLQSFKIFCLIILRYT